MAIIEQELDYYEATGEDTLRSNGSIEPSSPGDEELARTKSAASIADSFSLTREILFVTIICMAQFMTQGALGNCLNLLHVIGESFSLSNPAQLSWLIAGYSLTVGTFILVSGRFGDLFGYKRMFIIGFSWFTLWSMVAGLSVYSSHVLFVFSRVFQGIGPAIVMPNGLAILGATYRPGPRKTIAFALFGACAPGGNVFAAAFAGLFVHGDKSWWPWAFYSFAMGLAAITVMAVFIIPDPPHKVSLDHLSTKEVIALLDPLGSVVGIASLVLINFAWNQAPIVGWDQPYVYVLLIIGVLLVPVFFYIELHVASNPLIPFDVLNGNLAFILGSIACGWACFGIWVYYTWQFFQLLRGGSPLLTAAWMSPVAISGAAASMTTAWLLHYAHPALVMLIAMVSFTVGTVLMMTAPVGQSYWFQSFFSLIVMTWGMDMSFPAGTLILSNSFRKDHQGMAGSLVSTVVNYSISLGLGFAATVEVHVNRGGKTKEDLLFGYRAAWYMAVGLAGLGVAISTAFFLLRRKQSV